MAPTAFATKADFVRSMPDARPKEIMAAAAAAGLDLPRGYVKRVRFMDRKADGAPKRQGAPKARKPPRRRDRAGLKQTLIELARDEGNEAELRRLIAEVGLARTREIVAELEAALGNRVPTRSKRRRRRQVGRNAPKTAAQHREIERKTLLASLQVAGWHRGKAAKLSGLPRRTFYRKLHQHGIL
jgi:hypothetical protein